MLTEEICKLAVQQNGLALKYVKEQTNEICKLAVQNCGYSLIYVRKQTEELCTLAVKHNNIALRFVNPEFKACIMDKLAADKAESSKIS